MRSIRITGDEELESTKGQYLAKLEDIAMEMYTKTGVQMDTIRFIWTRSEVAEDDRMNEIGEDEYELQVKASDPQFI